MKKVLTTLIVTLMMLSASAQQFEGNVIEQHTIRYQILGSGDKIEMFGGMVIVEDECNNKTLILSIEDGAVSMRLLEDFRQGHSVVYRAIAPCDITNQGWMAYDLTGEVKISYSGIVLIVCNRVLEYKFLNFIED